MDDYIIVTCPHCGEQIQIMKNEINCTIFRHGVRKDNWQQIHPHTPKPQCDEYVMNDVIYGCGKPFKVDRDTYEVSICDYI